MTDQIDGEGRFWAIKIKDKQNGDWLFRSSMRSIFCSRDQALRERDRIAEERGLHGVTVQVELKLVR